MDRRVFLKAMGTAGVVGLLDPTGFLVRRARASGRYLSLHPFIEAHPEAVFIKRTGVLVKTDSEAKKQEGLKLAQELFTSGDTPDISLCAIKPNLTCLGGEATADRLGIVTDPDFVEGMVEGMKGLGLQADRIYLREGNFLRDAYCSESEALEWYQPLATRTGAHLTDFDSGRDMTQSGVARTNLEEGTEVIWREVPDGVIFRRIGYVAPINAPGAWNLNISKLKTHGMGVTLCCKNWQGTNINPYIHYCSSVPGQVSSGLPTQDLNPNYREDVEAIYSRHLEAGVPRWDRPGSMDNWNSGRGMETWVQKTLDNHSASSQGLCIIEGIYGRDGNWMNGPHDGSFMDFMTNVLIFGKSAFRVDIIGNWLAGHEPGNFGLFHSAIDRGLLDVLNPAQIPLYRWEDGVPTRTSLTAYERTPLVTYYMQRDYAGQSEPYWHLVDEPFDYGPLTSVEVAQDAKPQSYLLGQNAPNPFNASTAIEYRIPQDGYVSLDVYNSRGQRVDVLVDGWQRKGVHMASWNAGKQASGTYLYRFRTNGFEETRKMVLVR